MKILLLAWLLVLTACEATVYDEKEVFTIVEFTQDEAEEYRVRMDFVFFRSEVDQHPLAAKAVIDAITTWSGHVPIEVHITIQDDGTFPWVVVGSRLPSEAPGVIKVHLEQLDEKPWGHEKLAGAWLWQTRSLYIDAPDVDDMAYLNQVALHELGHALGLTHVVPAGYSGRGITGDISVYEAAEEYLMFPVLSEDNVDAMPSDIEIEIALQYVTGVMLHPGTDGGVDHFCLTSD